MTERVTFFGERGPEQVGRSHRFEDPEGRCTLLAWTRRAGPALAVETIDGRGHRPSDSDIRDFLGESGGGVLAEVRQGEGSAPASAEGFGRATVHLHWEGGGGGEARRAILLSPFAGASEIDLARAQEGLELRLGEHLLLPVSPAAEERLFLLQDLLSAMGRDVEALILHTLRSPSLDTRLGRLEEALALDRSGASAAARWWSPRGSRRARAAVAPARTGVQGAGRRRRWLSRPVGLVLVGLVILLLAAAVWLLLWPPSDPHAPGGPWTREAPVGLENGTTGGTGETPGMGPGHRGEHEPGDPNTGEEPVPSEPPHGGAAQARAPGAGSPP